MPANLTPAYFEAEKRFRAADTAEEKIEALNEMLRVMPKHKGTDALRAELRTKIAKLSKEAAKTQATARRGGTFSIPKEGAGQITLVGLPNVGKTRLVSSVTGVPLEVADYPFTTKLPQLGMMEFENVKIQLVDMPAITEPDARPWFATILRSTDVIFLVVDLSGDPVKQMADTLNEMEKLKMGIAGIGNTSADVLFEKRGIIVGNKGDREGSGSKFTALKSGIGTGIPVLSISAQKGIGLEELRKQSFDALRVVRVYTKSPGKQANLSDPMVLKAGSTVEEAAEAVHKDFRRGLKYALIWGSGKFPGQQVKRDHVVKDGDILELHA
ncbi:MAG: 50S ribosome-binding GTPase [Dehalococcoidia bacterium]|nr:50S ribosome-binding GTPase [Dehalococcoidia bacterium]